MIYTITILGILVTFGIFVWNGTQTWSQNKTRIAEIQQWANAVDLYKSRYAVFPGMPALPTSVPPPTPTLDYLGCLGTFSTTSNRCNEFALSSWPGMSANGASGLNYDNATLFTDIAKVGRVPENASSSIRDKYIGPFVYFNIADAGDGIHVAVTMILLALLDSDPASGCPSDTTQLLPPAILGDANTTTCYISRSFTYKP